MNAKEAGKLVGVMAIYDNRTSDDAVIVFWLKAIGDLDYADCEAAVVTHYRDSTEWVKPAHIRRQVAAIRAARLAAAGDELPTGDIADDPRAYLARLQRTRAAVAAGRTVLRQIGSPQ
jgi:hypothetical protein